MATPGNSGGGGAGGSTGPGQGQVLLGIAGHWALGIARAPPRTKHQVHRGEGALGALHGETRTPSDGPQTGRPQSTRRQHGGLGDDSRFFNPLCCPPQ
jgi:hypothetical protein